MSFILKEKVTFKGEQVQVQVDTYSNNRNIALSLLVDDKTEELYAVATVNVLDLESRFVVAIKDYNENEGIPSALVEAGVLNNEVVAQVPSGFVVIPIMTLTDSVNEQIEEKIKEGLLDAPLKFEPQGVTDEELDALLDDLK